MSMDDLDLLPNDNVAEDWEEREHCWEGRVSVDDQEGDMIDFEAVCQVMNAGSTFGGMSDDNHFVTSIYQLRSNLIDVTFDSSRCRKEEVANHSDVVWHFDDGS